MDFLVIKVKAGKGGNGLGAFDRSKTRVKGRPSGGSGGDGGNVIFRVNPSLNSLHHIPKQVQAGNGGPGGQENMTGARGEDLIVELPPGTVVSEVLEDEGKLQAYNSRLKYRMRQADPIDAPNMVRHLQDQLHETEFELENATDAPRVVCLGGRGGRGNVSLGRNNHEWERGHPGQSRTFQLDLNTLADFGLVGLPNAGKSSFLAAVSNAHPKVAPYPFTTLNPYVGTIQFADHSSLTVADIPGLIEGAHRNVGLGHRFLKHVVKSKALAFVIDFSRPEPMNDYQILCQELDLFRPGLASRCKLIVANKVDLIPEPEAVIAQARRYLPEDDNIKIALISAKLGRGIQEVTGYMQRLIFGTDTVKN